MISLSKISTFQLVTETIDTNIYTINKEINISLVNNLLVIKQRLNIYSPMEFSPFSMKVNKKLTWNFKTLAWLFRCTVWLKGML